MKHILILLFITIISLQGKNITPLTEEMEPWQIKDKDTLKGINVEIVKEIQKRIKNKNKILLLPWNRAYNMTLKKNEFALFSTTRTKQREKLFKWVGPLLPYEVSIYKHVDNTNIYNTLEDAKKVKTLAVTKNDVIEQYLTKQGFNNLKISFGKSAQYNLELLLDKKVTLLPISTFIAEYRIKNLGIKNKIVKTNIPPFLKNDMYIAFNINTPDEVIKKWQDALDTIKKDGTYKKIKDSYK